jgi:hypothetical protein
MFDEMVGHDAAMREAASTALSRLEVSGKAVLTIGD